MRSKEERHADYLRREGIRKEKLATRMEKLRALNEKSREHNRKAKEIFSGSKDVDFQKEIRASGGGVMNWPF